MRAHKNLCLTLGILVSGIIILLYLLWPRAAVEVLSLEEVTDSDARSTLDVQIQNLTDTDKILAPGEVYHVTSRNLLGAEQENYLLPVAVMNDIGALKTDTDKVQNGSLVLLSASGEGQGAMENFTLELDPGDNVDLAGYVTFLLTSEKESKTYLADPDEVIAFDGTAYDVGVSWAMGIVDNDLVAEGSEAELRLTFRFDVTGFGRTLAEAQTLTLVQRYTLYS